MAITSAAPRGYSAPGRAHTDYRAMSIATVLFFMWGFLTSLNDILIPHLKSIFELSYAEAALIQVAFFGSYFLFALPAGKLVEWRGYKQSMVIGLTVMAAGALLFLPAASTASYPLFLGALVVLAAGITCLQVAANPYVTSIGPENTASSRLNLSQAFNSLGTTIGPKLGGLLILGAGVPMAIEKLHSLAPEAQLAYRAGEASTVRTPYLIIAAVLLVLALSLAILKLPGSALNTSDIRPSDRTGSRSIWSQPWLLLGALGIFLYVGAEVSIGSYLISYFHDVRGMAEVVAAGYVSFYWGGAMVGRFIGSAILTRVKTGTLLGVVATVAAALVFISMATHGSVAMWTIIAVGLFNSVMFPNIFTLGLEGLGELTSRGSSLMVMAIVGGAVIPYAEGKMADSTGLQRAFIIPAICYVVIAVYGFAASRRSIPMNDLPA